METLAVAIGFIALLLLDWRYRARSLRFAAVFGALVVLWLSQPNITVAGRRASTASPAERSTTLGGEPLSDYMSGVVTMKRFVEEQGDVTRSARLVALGALVWLACAPLHRRVVAHSGTASDPAATPKDHVAAV